MDRRQKLTARQILKANMHRLKDAHPRIKNRADIVRATGVSDGTIGQMLGARGNPTLENIEAVAGAFGVEAWEMLFDQNQAHEKLTARIFG